MAKIGTFGPRVIGEDKYKAEREVVEKKSHIYGPRVLGDHHPAVKELESAKGAQSKAEARLKSAKGDAARKNAQQSLLAARKRAGKARAALAEAGTVSPPAKAEDGPGFVENATTVSDTAARTDLSELNLDELERWLEANPTATSVALDAELERSEPRKGALKAIFAVENRRPGGPREELVRAIEEALTPPADG